jgi:hypothetical protein
MKIDQCDRCLLYAHDPHLVCAVHPNGVEGKSCLDFRPNPNAEEEEELWSPSGYSWYDGNLIRNRPSRYTPEEQLEILDTHPFFTGVCPACGYEFGRNNPPAIDWDCPAWVSAQGETNGYSTSDTTKHKGKYDRSNQPPSQTRP